MLDEVERLRSEAARYCIMVEHEGFDLQELLRSHWGRDATNAIGVLFLSVVE